MDSLKGSYGGGGSRTAGGNRSALFVVFSGVGLRLVNMIFDFEFIFHRIFLKFVVRILEKCITNSIGEKYAD